MASSQNKGEGEGEKSQPENFAYTHLWVSSDGETHVKEGKLSNFDLKQYAASTPPQFVKPTQPPTKTVFSELSVGNEQDWHCCPQVQYVICLSGKWYIETSDGSRREFGPGEILFQDNIEGSPASKKPQHKSGVVGDSVNQQLILQVERKAEVDNPCPKDL